MWTPGRGPRSTALPRTVADAGILLEPRAPSATVAAAVHRVVTDESVRSRLVEAGRARHLELTVDASSTRLCELLTTLVSA